MNKVSVFSGHQGGWQLGSTFGRGYGHYNGGAYNGFLDTLASATSAALQSTASQIGQSVGLLPSPAPAPAPAPVAAYSPPPVAVTAAAPAAAPPPQIATSLEAEIMAAGKQPVITQETGAMEIFGIPATLIIIYLVFFSKGKLPKIAGGGLGGLALLYFLMKGENK